MLVFRINLVYTNTKNIDFQKYVKNVVKVSPKYVAYFLGMGWRASGILFKPNSLWASSQILHAYNAARTSTAQSFEQNVLRCACISFKLLSQLLLVVRASAQPRQVDAGVTSLLGLAHI